MSRFPGQPDSEHGHAAAQGAASTRHTDTWAGETQERQLGFQTASTKPLSLGVIVTVDIRSLPVNLYKFCSVREKVFRSTSSTFHQGQDLGWVCAR